MGRGPLRITVDTNILIRAAVGDDPDQSRLAAEVLRGAEIVAVALPTLCEFVWVLARGYGVEAGAIETAIRAWSIVRASGRIGQRLMQALPCSRRMGISQMASSPSRAVVWADRSSPASIAEPSN